MEIINLGITDYQQAYEQQLFYRDKVIHGGSEVIIICSHHPIVTLGRQSSPEDITGWQGETLKIERGGKATYHGPGQLIVYPIINLQKRNNDIHRYVRVLEKAGCDLLSNYDITSIGNPDGTSKTTGIWTTSTPSKKIASIGIAIKHWVTYHGMAINIYKDPLAFTGINPCGFTSSTMTSIEELINKKIDRNEATDYLIQSLRSYLE